MLQSKFNPNLEAIKQERRFKQRGMKKLGKTRKKELRDNPEGLNSKLEINVMSEHVNSTSELNSQYSNNPRKLNRKRRRTRSKQTREAQLIIIRPRRA